LLLKTYLGRYELYYSLLRHFLHLQLDFHIHLDVQYNDDDCYYYCLDVVELEEPRRKEISMRFSVCW